METSHKCLQPLLCRIHLLLTLPCHLACLGSITGCHFYPSPLVRTLQAALCPVLTYSVK